MEPDIWSTPRFSHVWLYTYVGSNSSRENLNISIEVRHRLFIERAIIEGLRLTALWFVVD